MASRFPGSKSRPLNKSSLQIRRERRRLRDQQRAQAYVRCPPLIEQGSATQPTRPIFQGRPTRLLGGDFQLLYLERHRRDPRSSTGPQTGAGQREPARLRLLHWDVQDRRPDPERRSPSGSNDSSLDPPGPISRELGRQRDVLNLRPNSGRRYAREHIPPIPIVPPLLTREIGDKIRDVSHLRLDLGRRCNPEVIPPLASAPPPSPRKRGQEKQGVPRAVRGGFR